MGTNFWRASKACPIPGSPDTGGMYRLLRNMEDEGLLKSGWNTSDSGPARRVYSITPSGEMNLFGWIQTLQDTHDWLEEFISDYNNYQASTTIGKKH